MADKMCENNQVTIMGEIVSDFSYRRLYSGDGIGASGQCAGECGGKMRLYYRTVPFIQPA